MNLHMLLTILTLQCVKYTVTLTKHYNILHTIKLTFATA